jgi:phospholipid N-methyltransferase
MENNNEFKHKATYSPEDNKLRMYPAFRIDKDDYLRFKSTGFIWAPKQKIFVAGRWTPQREDLLIEFCGEIGDEDTSLVERAEDRAERFEGYSENRLKDAEQAKEGVSAITENIPLGQPILVGHHSEKRARRDAERIEKGMRKAVKMWETSKYWTDRAAGALSHAKYLERPDVRARRIKKIESSIRKYKASYTPKNPDQVIMQTRYKCPVCGKMFGCEHPEAKEKIPHVFCGHSRGGSWVAVANLAGIEKYYSRWVAHCENRLLYEKAMLGEQGKLDLLNKPKRPKQLPLVNYRAPDGISVENMYHKGEFSIYQQVEMTKDEYKKIYSEYKGTATIENSHRVRIICSHRDGRKVVFLTDSKVHKKPEPVEFKVEQPLSKISINTYKPPEKTEFDDIKDSLKNGVKTVIADQLFITPPDLADKVIEYADLEPGMCVLEPSLGTGNLVKAVIDKVDTEVFGYEINQDLCSILSATFPSYKLQVRQADFLSVESPQSEVMMFPRIVMNPPFKNGDDIKHIKHALTFLEPGGKLVAICANGPRQREQLMSIADHWEDLPEGTFKSSGTMVNSALLVISN